MYAGNVALGGSEEAAAAPWEFDEATPAVLCWACTNGETDGLAGRLHRHFYTYLHDQSKVWTQTMNLLGFVLTLTIEI